MSAKRVLNTGVLSEFCKLRTNPAQINRSNAPHKVNLIKRDLFGQANPVETNKIFHEELEKHQEKAIKKWGFDFRNGSPLHANSQFIWERVSFQESSYAPEMYTLTRAAHVRPNEQPSQMDRLIDERAERENFASNLSACTDTDSCDDSQDESMVIFKVPAGIDRPESSVAVSCGQSTASMRKRQPKITDYMKERKRLAQTPKKVSPAKRMRTSSGSSSSSGHVSHSTQSHSISSHFSLTRSLPRNN